MEPLKGQTPGSSSPDPVSTKQQRIAELAKIKPPMVLTTLAHHMDLDWLREAYCRTRKDGAVGVDGQTATEYAANLEENLQSLLNRAQSGRYQAPPVRRTYIPKGTGKETRPLGIPADRQSPRRGHLADTGQRVPARSAGHLVRAGGAAPDDRTITSDPLRGRRGDGLRAGGRCATRSGGVAQAF